MTNQDPSADLSDLLRALGEEEEPTEPERSPFAIYARVVSGHASTRDG